MHQYNTIIKLLSWSPYAFEIHPPSIQDFQQPEVCGFLLESVADGFQKLMGTNWDQDSIILVYYMYHIDAKEVRSGPVADFGTSRWKPLYKS